jgi:heptosyltransferase-3
MSDKIKKISLKSANSVLIIVTREIGDVLLTTPLIHSIKQAWPNVRIDILAFKNKAGMLEGNPDIHQVLEINEHPSARQYLTLANKIFHQYDLAISTLPGDRPTIYAFIAAKTRIGIVPIRSPQSWFKYLINHGWVLHDDTNTHTIRQNLHLAEVLNIQPMATVILPQQNLSVQNIMDKLGIKAMNKYAIIHPFPRWPYKQWTKQGWDSIIKYLMENKIMILLTGGTDKQEIKFCQQLSQVAPNIIINLAGKLSFSEITAILNKAYVYIGPDTSVTHQAAACGVPTIALFGPSNPVKWGPWPKSCNCAISPYKRFSQTPQIINNVTLIQHEHKNHCVPCGLEGCSNNKESNSQCLHDISSDTVVDALKNLVT